MDLSFKNQLAGFHAGSVNDAVSLAQKEPDNRQMLQLVWQLILLSGKVLQHVGLLTESLFIEVIGTGNGQEPVYADMGILFKVILEKFRINQTAVRMPQSAKFLEIIMPEQLLKSQIKHLGLLFDVGIAISVILKTNDKNGLLVLFVQMTSKGHTAVIPDPDANKTVTRVLSVIELGYQTIKAILRRRAARNHDQRLDFLLTDRQLIDWMDRRPVEELVEGFDKPGEEFFK